MEHSTTTQEQRNELIEFRQRIYDEVLGSRRDAQFELLDALAGSGPVRSLAELSLSPLFRRNWSSLYAALEDGRLDEAALGTLLVDQLPKAGHPVFPLDGTAWPRPDSPTLPDRQYLHSPTPSVTEPSIVVGYPYSILAWAAEGRSSWTLPIFVTRVASTTTLQAVGTDQVRALCQSLIEAGFAFGPNDYPIVDSDGGYGNAPFLGGVRDLPCGVNARLRKDRVLFGPPGEYSGRGTRNLKHGKRFAFKEPETWGDPVERVGLEDPKWGEVEIRLWEGLHALEDAQTVFSVVQAQVHRERAHPPDPMWLAWQAPTAEALARARKQVEARCSAARPASAEDPPSKPTEDPPSKSTEGLPLKPTEASNAIEPVERLPEAGQGSAERHWRDYLVRWGIEPSIRSRKQDLHWTVPQVQIPAACDLWTHLVTLAQWLLYLARPLAADRCYPWYRRRTQLTPSQVQRAFVAIFLAIGTPAAMPQTRGNASGWPAGKPRAERPKYSPVYKGAPAPERASRAGSAAV